MSQGFFGRRLEIESLLTTFREAGTRRAADGSDGPRMTFVLAESGVGKSRLVQELYIRLTEDPAWDPPEIDYWPPAFGDGGVNLAVIPSMKGHVPKGPPRFAWLGARWQSPLERNALERRSVLPDLRSSVTVHAEVLRSHGSAWSDAVARAVATARQEATGVVIDVVGIPFFGLLSSVATNVKDFAAERLAGPKRFEDLEADDIQGEVDEVLGCLRSLLDGKGAVPTVLWLDDAQWIDAESLEFVRRLWTEAERRRWPLFIVVTHWEREWRELKLAARDRLVAGDLTDFEGRPGVAVIALSNADAGPLDAYLASRLPGLTAPQRAMLVDKAGGNFLTMVENVGELLRHPANFVDRDPAAALSRAGELKVARWESIREKRVEQRFGELEPEVQDLLGWSSQLGLRFLREVVEEFAQQSAALGEPGTLIERCVDPYVILGKPGEHTREFRDKAFHAVASRYFADYGAEQREALSAVLRRHLVEWVNNSFDGEGSEIWPGKREGIEPPERSATALEPDERRDLLGMAMRELPLSTEPDWSDPEHIAAFRAVYLAVITEYRDRLWHRVGGLCRLLDRPPFGAVPIGVLSSVDQEWLSATAHEAGAFNAAEIVAGSVLLARREAAAQDATAEHLEKLAAVLVRAGNIAEARGGLGRALALYDESLSITRRLVAQQETSARLDDLVTCLSNIGDILQARGDMDGALQRYEDSLAVMRRLTSEEETPTRMRNVSLLQLSIGGILEARGDWDGALIRYEDSLALVRRLIAEEDTAQRQRDLSVVLNNVGDVLSARGDWDGAWRMHEEGLAIARRLMADEETPLRVRDLFVSLNKMGMLMEMRDDLVGALERYQEGLSIARRSLAEEETADRLRDLALSLQNVGDILQARADWSAALTHYEESLSISRRLLAEERTSHHLRDVCVTVDRVGDIFKARNDWDGALERYEESLGIVRQLLAQEETPQRLRDLSVSVNNVAEILKAKGDLEEALQRHEEGLRIRRDLLAREETPERLRDVGISLNMTGNVLELQGRFDDASSRYGESLAIARRLLAVEETPQRLRDLSSCLENAGDIHKARQEWDRALECHQECLAIRRRLLAYEETPTRLQIISYALIRIGNIFEFQERFTDALTHHEESLSIARRLLEVEETPGRLRDLTVNLDNLADVLLATGDRDGALPRYAESLDVRLRLIAHDPTPDRLRETGLSLMKTGNLERALGRTEAALGRYRANIDIADRLSHMVEAEPERFVSALNEGVWSVHLAAGCLMDLSRPEETSTLLSSHLPHVTRLADICGEQEMYLDTCAAYWESTAKAAEALGDAARAADAAARGAEFRRRITPAS
jgi:tetratricopeptide (TPR) repeat protein